VNRRTVALLAMRPLVRHLSLADLDGIGLTDVDLVSLDVFDTCLGRAVADPTHLFVLLGRRSARQLGELGLGLTEEDTGGWFRSRRIAAESRARVAHAGREPNIEAIYQELAIEIADPSMREHLLQAELELEHRFSVARAEVLAFARRVVESGRRLVYLSDMYLPSATIAGLLDRADFPKADVLVSNETGVSKANGDAYGDLCRRFGAAPGRTLHVGDNLRADGWSAARRGLRAIIVDRALLDLRRELETHPVPDAVSVGDGVILALGANRAPSGPAACDTARRLGATAIAPAQLGFASWLDDQLASDEVPLFCSRDMLDVRQLHERLRHRTGRAPVSHYLEVSRRSVGLPALAGGIADGDREFLTGGRGLISEAELWERIGLGHVATGQADATQGRPAAERDAVWARMREREDVIVGRARDELLEFRRYWERNELPTSGPTAIVDVGWRATVQRSLARCLRLAEIDVELRGFYLALLEPDGDGIEARGWLVDGGRPVRQRIALEAGIPIIELLFQADEGSVERYRDGHAVRGPVSSTRHVQDSVQRAAAEVLDEWIRLQVPDRPTELATRPLLRLLNTPRPEEAAVLGSITHTDRLGSVSTLRSVLPPSVGLWSLTLSPGSVRTIRSCEWRPGLFALGGAPRAIRRLVSTGLGGLKLVGRLAVALRGFPPREIRRDPDVDRLAHDD
jgi:FMN phosphatase YigB (HAD superfamily)